MSVALDGDHAVLSVSDDGPGMDSETAEHIFDRFFRADQSRTRASGGSGLGLSIVATIVKRHDGSISVKVAPEGAQPLLFASPRP